VDGLSTDILLLTIGGDEKMTCRAREAEIVQPDSSHRRHGRFSWLLAQALIETASRSTWTRILASMEDLTHQQGWDQPLLFRGQPTVPFGL
jgi:hypothetical protein